ncbi:Antitoxin component, type II toxin-antitoxin system [Candidatus Promineifilum breve]|uniref:Antitoxin n=1 Tax=Candidatus Promineifilum breve TaxID=1806508 RepID=A0A160T2P8_9CHLR|nr:Antitoxin component, type II toxin-antitoxin system [Candidatus Promineifilum breve]
MNLKDSALVNHLPSYSLAEARDHLTAIVRDVEMMTAVELTRRGKPVAVIVSIDEYRRLSAPTESFSAAVARFREEVNLDELDLGPKLFAGIRDTDPGREPPW